MVSIKMSETKEETVCNHANNHRQHLLNHQQEIDRDLEAGSCADEDDEETQLRMDDEGGGENEDDEVFMGEEAADGEAVKPKAQVIPPLYNVEPGCTALGCYSAIATLIVMIIGIVALLMYSSPGNARADRLVFPNVTSSPEDEELFEGEDEMSSGVSPSVSHLLFGNVTMDGSGDEE